MAVTYTTASLVRKNNKNIDLTDLIDSDLDRGIYRAESLMDTTMCHSFLTTFDATKYQILEGCATDLATLYAITYDPGTTELSLDDFKAITENLNKSIDRYLAQLSDPKKVAWLKTL